MTNVLFVCSANRLRSPTAEQVFSTWLGVETDWPAYRPAQACRLSSEQIDWADMIFVMEKTHRNKSWFAGFVIHLKNKRVICFDIPDDYEFMDHVLVRTLESRVGRSLARAAPAVREGTASWRFLRAAVIDLAPGKEPVPMDGRS